MNIIICSKCGKIPYYVNTSIQKEYLFFDADGKEVDVASDPVQVGGSTIPRCWECKSKVNIYRVKGGKE